MIQNTLLALAISIVSLVAPRAPGPSAAPAIGKWASVSASDPIVTEGAIKAPVDEVWKAFTTKEGIETWMVAKTEIELKVGGAWRTSYSKDSNLSDDATIVHTILSLDPGRMLSFRTVKTPKGFPYPDELAKTWCVVYFEPSGPKETKLTLRMFGYDESENSKKMRAFFERGNKVTIDELVKKFANG